MRVFRLYLVLVFGGVLATGCGSGEEACECPADDVSICGHRGTGVNDPQNPYPENTLPSFAQAEAEGADMIELDVHHSADGALVVIHDETVNRTTDGTGCVGDLTVAELQELDAGFGSSLEGTGVVVPTLGEALAAVTVPVNIEIKIESNPACPAPDTDQLAVDVVAAIQSDAAARRIVVSSFDLDVLLAIGALDDTIYIGYLGLQYLDAQEAADNGFAGFNVFAEFIDPADIQRILDTGVEANVWTVNDPDTMASLMGTGVSIFITDEPDVARQVARDYCADYCAAR